jgi:DNA-binding Xre family transcriptional regulator
MNKLGEYFELKSVNQSDIARKTGLSNSRISELATKPNAHLRAKELYLIALAMDVNPCDMLEALYGELKASYNK